VRRSLRSAGMTILATLITSSSWFLLTAARTPAPGDACSLLSKEDAAAALGEAATGPKATGPRDAGAGGTVSACEYTGSGLHRVQLNLTRLAAANVAMFKGILCRKKTKDGLAGLGDLACWYNDKHGDEEGARQTEMTVGVPMGQGSPGARAVGGPPVSHRVLPFLSYLISIWRLTINDIYIIVKQ
jgi:hypothetical protein